MVFFDLFSNYKYFPELKAPKDLYFFDFPIPDRYDISDEEDELIKKAMICKRNENYLKAEEIYIKVLRTYGPSCILYAAIAKTMACQLMIPNAAYLMKVAAEASEYFLGDYDLNMLHHANMLIEIRDRRMSDYDAFLYLKSISGNDRFVPKLRKLF